MPGPPPARTLVRMAGVGRRLARRRPVWPLAVPLAAALVLTGCTAGAPEGGPPARATPVAPPPEAASRTAVEDVPGAGVLPTPVDLAQPGSRAEVPLEVAAAVDGGAHVVVGDPPLGPPTRLVTVTAGAEVSGSVAVRELDRIWDLHPLDDGTVLISGTLAGEEAAGWLRLDPGGGRRSTVAAVPLAEGNERVEGLSAVSDDGGTVFLYVVTTVEGRPAELLEAWDLAGGELIAARDLFADVRGVAAPFAVPDAVSLVTRTGGGVSLVTNIWQERAGHLPAVLTWYDDLTPAGPLLPLGPAATDPAARVAVGGADGGLLVLLRGSPASTIVAVPPDGGRPTPLVAVPRFGSTDRLSLGPDGVTALLEAPGGAGLVDLPTARTTPVDVGCPAVPTITALAMATSGRRALVLGSCAAPGPSRPTLWIAG